MSLMTLLVDLIQERGQATVDDLMPEIEGYSRQQVLDALKNAAYRKRLDCITGRRGAGRKGGLPGIYKLAEEEVARRAPPVLPRINSVWQLGEMA